VAAVRLEDSVQLVESDAECLVIGFRRAEVHWMIDNSTGVSDWIQLAITCDEAGEEMKKTFECM
jgi:hypothetical protein